MNDLLYFTSVGFFLGYSKEAVVAFLKRRHDINTGNVTSETPTNQDTHLEYLLIPSERELAMSREEVIADINSRRHYSVPFPADDTLDWDDEYHTFFKTEPEGEVKLNWIAYLLYVVHNTTFLQEVSHESHLHTDTERRV